MIWTREKPTQPGWYWYRTLHHGKPTFVDMVRVYPYGDTFLVRSMEFAGTFIKDFTGEWAGPIEEPEEKGTGDE